MTALANALRLAGITSPQDRLTAVAYDVAAMTVSEWAEYRGCISAADIDRIQRRLIQMAREAIQQSPCNWDGAKDAFYARVRKDPDLLWELLAPYRAAAAQFWLTQAAGLIRSEEKLKHAESAGGQVEHASHTPAAPRASAAAGAAAVAAVTRLSLLDTFRVNGRPIGELTSSEANAWAGSRERDARFVRLLTQNLPPDQPIKKYRTGEEATALMALAEKSDAE